MERIVVGVRGWFSGRPTGGWTPEGWGTTRVAKATLRASQPRLTLARSLSRSIQHPPVSSRTKRKPPTPFLPAGSLCPSPRPRPVAPLPPCFPRAPFSALPSPYVPLHVRITVDRHKPTPSRPRVPLFASPLISWFPSPFIFGCVFLRCSLSLPSRALSVYPDKFVSKISFYATLCTWDASKFVYLRIIACSAFATTLVTSHSRVQL